MDQFQEQYIKARKEVIRKNFSHLNDRQQQAVLATEGPLLILAGAGSGKTTVLINRIANLMKFGCASDSTELPAEAGQEQLDAMNRYLAGEEEKREEAEKAAALHRVSPWKILAITFTNKAAGELKSRLAAMLGEEANDIWAKTFHSACARMLRSHAHLLGYPDNFTIYDTSDRTSVIKRLVKENGYPDKDYNPRDVLSYIDKQRGMYLTPAQAKEKTRKTDSRDGTLAELYGLYAKQLMEAGAMDFDDLLYNMVRILTDFPDVREYYQNKFQYILVDEYQDTNKLQYMLVHLLSASHQNLCVVGDDDQSIYSFRGATIKNILSFESDYTSARTIRLEQNYRSTGHILDAANAVVAHNSSRKSKTLWTEADSGEPIQFYLADSEEGEARFVVQKVLQAVEQGAKLGDHAVLYRVNAQSRVLEQEFMHHGIRPMIVKGNPFFERAEIKDILSYFFVILNPSDDLRLRRIINTPMRGIGNTTVDRAAAIAEENGLPLFTVLSMADQFPELKRPAPKLMAFAAMMNKLAEITSEEGVLAAYDAILEKTQYLQSLLKLPPTEAKNKIENVQELKSYIVEEIDRTGDSSLEGFLDEISLYTDLEKVSDNEDTVKFMTVHSSKGLEFPTVFLVGMDDGIFPAQQAIGSPEQMEEERRLAYVAITRAQKRLYITSAERRMMYGVYAPHSPSRFIGEIPASHMETFGRQSAVGTAQSVPGYGRTARGDLALELDDDLFGDWLEDRMALEQLREKERADRTPKEEKKASPVLKQREKNQDKQQSFAVSDRVKHKTFGEGTIVKMTPAGNDQLVEIQMDDGKVKRIMLRAGGKFLTKLDPGGEA